MSGFQADYEGQGPATRQVPRYVPTLTEVVDWVPLTPTQSADPVLSQSVAHAGLPGDLDQAHSLEAGPGIGHHTIPMDAVIEEVVDRALDRLVMRLTDKFETQLATHLTRWRNEEARAWAAAWVAEQMDQGLLDLRSEVSQLAQEEVQRLTQDDASGR